jgi:YrbI family 3-deoxy-D-manno-octulosonate 8-phosphate phosphatase
MIMLNLNKKQKKIIAFKEIDLVITDVDGVLTDGGRYYSKEGENLKKFHVRDGMGINLLLRNKIKTIIVTKEDSPIVKKWAKDMNISAVYNNAIIKELELPKICKKFNTKPNKILFIGDDVNDLELMKKIRISVSPKDANYIVKKNVDYVCSTEGGKGVLREISDLILLAKFPNKKKWY